MRTILIFYLNLLGLHININQAYWIKTWYYLYIYITFYYYINLFYFKKINNLNESKLKL
jgi:hypothetical protein